MTFYRRWQVVLRQVNGQPITKQQIDASCPAFGYVFTVATAMGALQHIRVLGSDVRGVEAFVLSTVDSMLSNARVFPDMNFQEEKALVLLMETVLASPLRSNFLTSLRTRWTAAPFQAMLRSRHLLDAVAEAKSIAMQHSALRDADVAAHGLHPCGLPSCDEREATVKQFKYCGDCEAEWYCCAEHQVLHWKEHKPICRARAAAAAKAAPALD